jgi:two-component system heavy metal sensor histidine kinase CusS
MRRLFLKPYSISARLTLMFAAATVLLLAASEGSLYWMLSRNVSEQGRHFLSDKLNVLQLILANQPGQMEPLREEVQWEAGARRHSRFYSRVVDASGRLILETQGMSALFLGAPFPTPNGENPEMARGALWRPDGERCYLLGSAMAREGISSVPTRRLEVAVDMSDEDELLEDYRRNMIISFVAGLFVAGLLGYVAARKGLTPLELMARKAREITADRLHERMANEEWPKELCALASAFDEMLARLEESFVRLSTFSADLAHDLRTPLNNCMGELEVALSKPREPVEYQQALGSALEEMGRLSRMMDSLLFLARAGSAQAKAERAWLDASEEMEAIRRLYEAVALERDVALRTEGAARVFADPLLLRRALGNLLSNAIRHSPSGGTVVLSARETRDAAVMEVADEGSGISPDELPRIFSRFYRPAQSRALHPQGLGLGLAIVKSVMDLHKGSVHAESTVGKGTRITLRFPKKQT